jgi:TatD DNase family protein
VTPLFDAHAHLQDPRVGEGLTSLLDRAGAAGVGAVVCCGTEPSDWPRVLALAAAHPQVVPMLGLHPWMVDGAPGDWMGRLEDLVTRHPVALGECGLDFAREGDCGAQELALRLQLRLAKRLDRPVALHCVKAHGRLAEILREEGLPSAGGLIHAYSGSAEMARVFQDLGLHLSFAAGITRPGNRKAAEVVAAVRPDRLLVESDTPDQGPGGAPSEPAQVGDTLQALARFRGESVEAVAALTWANGTRLFGRGTA